MPTLSDYKIICEVYQSHLSTIYRGIQIENNTPVVIKQLNNEYPSPLELASFKREYEIAFKLSGNGIIKVYDFKKHEKKPAIIFEDFGGDPLSRILTISPPDLAGKLSIAIKMTEALGEIHQQNIIHKDINPTNFLWNPETNRGRIIDFGISTELSRENPEIRNPNILEGTLNYISPEQTGRMNRAMDYRTDLYSLGISFYEIFTGQLPFISDDAMEMVHSHIAKIPPAPSHINPIIPEPVSDIVMKLLSKTAEDRYQNTSGIKNDLEHCLEQLTSKGIIDSFEIGHDDISDRFQIPQKLYGRETEIETLLTSFDRVSRGSKEIMMVAGYSGIGKSALVNEINKPISEKGGNFISGKYDQYKRNIPYSAVIQAFQELVKHLLAETEEQLSAWRQKLLKGLGPSAQVIIDVIPEFELILGKQPPVQELNPEQSRNRFNIVFQTIVRIFAQEKSPLVIFIDDLQWADLPSLQLIEQVMADIDTRYFFAIGAYRNNEVDASHSLLISAKALHNAGSIINTITLKPLKIDHVNDLISDTLFFDSDQASPLAKLCMDKTLGNPFFVNQLLISLYEKKMINFDAENRNWIFNTSKIGSVNITDYVIELMTEKIQRLPDEAQSILKLASCIGNQFDLDTLAVVSVKSKAATAQILYQALKENLVVPLGDSYKFISASNENLKVSYRFLHDRIQQAAYSLIEDNYKQEAHLKIGRILLKNTPEKELNEKIFNLVSHLNHGISLIHNQSEKDNLTKLNLLAGQKAKKSAAYKPAYEYFKTGIDIMGETGWDKHYTWMLSLHDGAQEACYLSGDYDRAGKLFDAILNKTNSVDDRVKAYEVRILTLVSMSKFQEAIDTGKEILRLLGVKLPQSPKKWHILVGLLKMKFVLSGKTDEALLTLKEMKNPLALARDRILLKIGTAAYFSQPELYPLTVFNRLHLSVKYGNDPISSFSSYAGFAIILCSLGLFDEGYRFGKLSLRMVTESPVKTDKTRILMLMNTFIRHWKEPIRDTLKPLIRGFESRLETGDIEFASHAAWAYCSNIYFSGKNLKEVEKDQESFLKAIKLLNQKFDFDTITLFHQTSLRLINPKGISTQFTINDFSEDDMIKVFKKEGNKSSLLCYHILKLNLNYCAHQYEEALSHIIHAYVYIDSGRSTFLIPYFYFYESLTRLALCHGISSNEKKKHITIVVKNQKKLKKLANHAPVNFLHKWHLVEAEKESTLCKFEKATEHYKKAIERAKSNQYVQEEALAYELYAQFLFNMGENDFAEITLKKSCYCYSIWGAEAKVAQLETSFPELLKKSPAPQDIQQQSNLPGAMGVTHTGSSDFLDLSSIMKASRTIARQVGLSNLLVQLMKITMENAGAQKGFIILEKKGAFFIEAEASTEKEGVQTIQSIPLSNHTGLSNSIVNYVSRSKELLILNNASEEGNYTNDPYVLEYKPKSILCSAILNQGKLSAIVYLENNLSPDTFTQERIELLRILSAQAAISIDNARLYDNLEEKVKARTEELNHSLKKINSSIRYSGMIQQSLLPDPKKRSEYLPASFFIWEPRDTVGGDIYFCEKMDNGIIIAIIDCTGHGVPGGFLTMLASSALRRIVNEERIISPSEILKRLNYSIKTSLQQDKDHTSSDDGFDAAICFFDTRTKKMTFSSARIPLYIINNNELTVIKGDKKSIGYVSSDLSHNFKSHEIENPDLKLKFYMTTDGFTDQLGGIKNLRFGTKRFKELITGYHNSPFENQSRVLMNALRKYQGNQERIDDVTVVGFRFV